MACKNLSEFLGSDSEPDEVLQLEVADDVLQNIVGHAVDVVNVALRKLDQVLQRRVARQPLYLTWTKSPSNDKKSYMVKCIYKCINLRFAQSSFAQFVLYGIQYSDFKF